MECPSCHAEIDSGSVTCRACGTALHRPCPACGALAAPRARYCSECGHRLAPPTPAEAERRQLTVMFCDLVDSTTLAARLDPEDLRATIGAYQRCVSSVVAQHGGFLARFMGDGALVYFGFPLAREDDAERAMRAGLAAVEAVSALVLHDGYRPRVRIGIATGLVVVGGSDGSEMEVAGDTPNLAARLQTIAEPNSVVVAASTRRLGGGLFVYRALPPAMLKGYAEPVSAWQVLRTSTSDSRFDARREARLAPLLGRGPELDALERRWGEAREGRGRVVLLCGEAGIGKSRLTAMLQERVAAEPHARLRYFCSPDGARTPFYPSIRQIEHTAGFARDDSPARKLAKLHGAFAAMKLPPQDLALIADLLGLPAKEGAASDLSPRERRERTMEVLLRNLELVSRRQPTLAIAEDAQWIDPSSLELLDRAIARIPRWPILLVVTYRPEFHARWADQPHVSALTLGPLAHDEAAAVVEHVAGKGALAPGTVEDIVERADGVPLFLEELTKAVIEGGGSAGALPAKKPRGSSVPDTLQASLMSRLDRLGPAKEIAQIGAAIGREFSSELVAAVAGKGAAEVERSLARLTDAGLAFHRQGPQSTYIFKHALIRDAAYDTLLRETRRTLHRKIAEALEAGYADAGAAQPELLAHHCAEAGLTEKALGHWIKAGQDAIARSAMAEAIARLRKGLDLVATLPETDSRHQRELDLQLALGSVLIATKGYVAPDTIDAFSRARALCKQLNQSPQLVSVLHGQWVQAIMRNELLSARRRAVELLEVAEASGDASSKWTACRLLGTTCYPMGEFAAGRDYLEQSIALADTAFKALGATSGAGEAQAARLAAYDEAHVFALVYLGHNLLYLGHLDAARRRNEEALDHARLRAQAYTVAHALIARVLLELMLDTPAQALASIERLLAFTEKHAISYYTAIGTVFHGRCLMLLGRAREGVAQIKKGLSAYRAMGTSLYMPSFLLYLAEAHGAVGDAEEGLRTLDKAAAVLEETQARQDEAELYRARGELSAVLGRADAEQWFERALAVARGQNAKLLELRAALSFARFQRGRAKAAAANETLAAVHASFAEGLNTAALTGAKALLEELV